MHEFDEGDEWERWEIGDRRRESLNIRWREVGQQAYLGCLTPRCMRPTMPESYENCIFFASLDADGTDASQIGSLEIRCRKLKSEER